MLIRCFRTQINHHSHHHHPPLPVDGQLSNEFSFFYYEVNRITKPYGPIHGTTTVMIHGNGFVDFGIPIDIRFGKTNEPGFRWNSVNGILLNNHTIACVTPAHWKPEILRPTLSMNNQTWAPTTNNFTYYRYPVLSSLLPVLGPLSGATTVSLYGTNFFNTTVVRALFNGIRTTCILKEDRTCFAYDADDGDDDGDSGQTEHCFDVAECPTPSQLNVTIAQFVFANLSIDTDDTADQYYTGENVQFYYHRQNYTVQGPFPPMLPDRGLIPSSTQIRSLI